MMDSSELIDYMDYIAMTFGLRNPSCRSIFKSTCIIQKDSGKNRTRFIRPITIHDLSSSLKENEPVDAALLDFSKSFDMVAHQRLDSKLDHYGIQGNLLR